MRYAILCFTAEELARTAWTPTQDAEVMRRVQQVCDEFVGKIAQTARLLPTTSAVSVRKDKSDPVVVDGPFIESKEHFVGFYVIDCETLDVAVDFARNLMAANPWGSGYEIRPIGSSGSRA